MKMLKTQLQGTRKQTVKVHSNRVILGADNFSPAVIFLSLTLPRILANCKIPLQTFFSHVKVALDTNFNNIITGIQFCAKYRDKSGLN